MSGQDPPIREITKGIINTVKKNCEIHAIGGSQIL